MSLSPLLLSLSLDLCISYLFVVGVGVHLVQVDALLLITNYYI